MQCDFIAADFLCCCDCRAESPFYFYPFIFIFIVEKAVAGLVLSVRVEYFGVLVWRAARFFSLERAYGLRIAGCNTSTVRGFVSILCF